MMADTAPPIPTPRRSWRVALALAAAIAAVGPAGWGAWSLLRARGPADHWAEVKRGRAFLERGRPDLALRAVAPARRGGPGPGTGEAMAVAGEALIRLGRLGEARHALEAALGLNPAQADPAKWLAALYLSASDTRRALPLLEHAAKLDPADARPWLVIGKVNQELVRDHARAAVAFAEALRRAPDDLGALTGRAAALLDAGRAREAGAPLDRALRLAPDDAKVLGLAARRARDQGDRDGAAGLAERSLAADPDNRDALLISANLALAGGDPGKAHERSRRAAELDPDNQAALVLRAQAESRLGMRAEAAATLALLREAKARAGRINALVRAIADRPSDAEPQWRLGREALASGLTALAENCFRTALDLDPSCAEARDGLTRLRRAAPSR